MSWEAECVEHETDRDCKHAAEWSYAAGMRRIVRYLVFALAAVVAVAWAVLTTKGAVDDATGLWKDLAAGDYSLIAALLLVAIGILALGPEILTAVRATTHSRDSNGPVAEALTSSSARATDVDAAEDRGWLDAYVEARRNAPEFNKVIIGIGKDTNRLGEKIAGHGKRMNRDSDDPEKVLRHAGKASKDTRSFAHGLATKNVRLRSSSQWPRGIATYLDNAQGDVSGYAEVDGALATLLTAARSGREGAATLRNTMVRLRKENAAASLTDALGEASMALDETIDIIKDLERGVVMLRTSGKRALKRQSASRG